MTSCVGSSIVNCGTVRDRKLWDFMHHQLVNKSDLKQEFQKMHTTTRRYQSSSLDAKDTFAVKGIIALLVCVAYAGVLFCLAAIVTTIYSIFVKSAHSVCLNIWEAESTKKMDSPKPVRKSIRHGQK